MMKCLDRYVRNMDMKYSVKYLPSLARDILRISEALEEYPDKAKRLFQEMDGKILKLEDMPLMCPIFHARPKYRMMVLEGHILFYTVDAIRHEVKLHRILYSKMDVPRYLGDEK